MKSYNELKGCGIPAFPENSRVCFLGDSLTCGSIWVQMIFDYYLKAFPKANIRINDCGIGQGTARYGIETMDEDLLTFDPTHVVIMYGENDVKGFPGTAEDKMKSFYRDMKELTEILLAKGITVYYMSEPASDKDHGLNMNIREIASLTMDKLAREFNTSFCDLYKALSPLLTAEMVDGDQIHLTEYGGTILARVFLHLQGFDGFTPEDEGFYERFASSYDLEHRRIFNDKIRRVWVARRAISTYGDTTEAKIRRLYGRIETRADGAWDDFCYYRAVDFIELYPHVDFYREELDRTTERMIKNAMNS